MKIILLTINYNQGELLKHFLQYYQFCDKIVVYDDKLTDNSIEVIKSFNNTEISNFYQSDKVEDKIFTEIKNEHWKQYRKEYDWVIIADVDEFLYFPHTLALDDLLDDYTVLKPKGYDMITEKNINEIDNIFTVNKGIRNEMMDKCCMFNIKEIESINYEAGCHKCNPKGNVKYFEDKELKLLHYKYLGLEDGLKRKNLNYERLSDYNKERGWDYKI
jgi:hypothetical protein